MMSRVGHARDHSPRPAEAAPGSTPPGDLDAAVRAARGGDEDAFRALYRDVQPRLLRYAAALVGDDAEDVTSETWLHIARDIASFAGDIDGFRGWAATIARNRALDHRRYHRRRPVAPAPVDDLIDPPAPDDTELAALDALSTRAALALIGRLPRDQAEIILLRVVVGLDAESVARIVGKSSGAVRTAAHRALRRLARHLTARERADDPVRGCPR